MNSEMVIYYQVINNGMKLSMEDKITNKYQ